jgi:uncharacterized protein YjbI with pentapeptide repeats
MYKFEEKFEGVDYSSKDIVDGEFENCTFQSCNFAKADLSGVLLVDCAFVGCDLSLAVIKKTAFRSVDFDSCKLVGLRFEDAGDFAFECRFRGCNLDLSTFSGRDLRHSIFERCSMKETDLAGADLSGVALADCDLHDAVFDGTNLEKSDFRTAVNFVFDPEFNRVSKARFSNSGLAGLLAKYDIVIEP